MKLTNVTEMDREEMEVDNDHVYSLKGTLFATVVFVGGVIVLFIVLLFVIYMTRL